MNFVDRLRSLLSHGVHRDDRESFSFRTSRLFAHCCGIVGYLGEEDTNEILLHGINAMKSRGYDSCGICTLDAGKLKVTKCCSVGTPADSYNILVNKVLADHKPSVVGIGHTRWATVGKLSDKNSHPHVDLAKNLALVHNGTISNIEELYHEHYQNMMRNKLSGKTPAKVAGDGFGGSGGEDEKEFTLPDSDSEALAIFIGLEYEQLGNLYEAFKNTIRRLRGTWALCMMSAHHPNSLFVAAHEAPLLFARSERGVYVGSEPTVFSKYAKDCVALKDGEVFELSRENVETYYRRSRLLKLEHEVIEETPEPYPNWLLKELSEQVYMGRIIISMLNANVLRAIDAEHRLKPNRDAAELLRLRDKYAGNDSLTVLGGDANHENELLARTDVAAIGFDLPSLPKEVRARLRRTNRLLLVACGSSMHAANYVAKILQKINHFETVEVDDASDLTLYRYHDRDNTVIHISNSGETMDCILSSNFIKKINPDCLNLSLINTLHTSLERATDATLYLRIGREKAVPSTKAFTAQVTVLLILGLYIVSAQRNQDAMEESSTECSSSGEKDDGPEQGEEPEITARPAGSLEKYVEHYGSCENYRIAAVHRALARFPAAIAKMLEENAAYDAIARKLATEKVVYILGRGCGHVAACEAALKMKEVAYIQAEAVLSGAMKHGYYAMIVEDERTPTISIITSEDKEMTINSTMQLKARGSYIIALTDLHEDLEFADAVITLPNVGAMTAALAVVPIQAISYRIAVLAGRNPDIPRGLAKTVTTL